jgi:hypothetical protein
MTALGWKIQKISFLYTNSWIRTIDRKTGRRAKGPKEITNIGTISLTEGEAASA